MLDAGRRTEHARSLGLQTYYLAHQADIFGLLDQVLQLDSAPWACTLAVLHMYGYVLARQQSAGRVSSLCFLHKYHAAIPGANLPDKLHAGIMHARTRGARAPAASSVRGMLYE